MIECGCFVKKLVRELVWLLWISGGTRVQVRDFIQCLFLQNIFGYVKYLGFIFWEIGVYWRGLS